jgi:hypothetical protein
MSATRSASPSTEQENRLTVAFKLVVVIGDALLLEQECQLRLANGAIAGQASRRRGCPATVTAGLPPSDDAQTSNARRSASTGSPDRGAAFDVRVPLDAGASFEDHRVII